MHVNERNHPPLRRCTGIDWYTRLAAEGTEHEPIETYSNGVRHVKIPDPDGNAIAFAEPPDAASASPRSVGTGASRKMADPRPREEECKRPSG
jgi:hypothetical protein